VTTAAHRDCYTAPEPDAVNELRASRRLQEALYLRGEEWRVEPDELSPIADAGKRSGGPGRPDPMDGPDLRLGHCGLTAHTEKVRLESGQSGGPSVGPSIDDVASPDLL